MTRATAEKKSWSESAWFKSLDALRPWLGYVVAIIMVVTTLYLSFRDTSASQAISLTELERKTDLLQKTMEDRKVSTENEFRDMKTSSVTMQLFNERTQSMQRQLDTIMSDQKEILNRLPVRNP